MFVKTIQSEKWVNEKKSFGTAIRELKNIVKFSRLF